MGTWLQSIPYYTYYSLFYYFVVAVVVLYVVYLQAQKRELSSGHMWWCLALVVVVGILMGYAPMADYGDKFNYAAGFRTLAMGWEADVGRDAGWHYYTWVCGRFLTVTQYFILTAIIYSMGFFVIANHVSPAYRTSVFLMYLSFFLFVGYATNTIRGGFASALLLMAVSQFEKRKIWFIILAFAAVQCHKSMWLPVGAFVLAYFWTSNRWALVFWAISIPVSAVAGHYFELLFAPFVEEIAQDSSSYLTAEGESNNYKVGFRLDFILFSLAPVVWGWYQIEKRRLKDFLYGQLYRTYLIANFFWILVIRAPFSDRFAYLSWMFGPLLLLYPIVRGSTSGTYKNRAVSYMLLGSLAFYVYMHVR